ncbi:MAG TPA: class I SAM-dependent methyltransferase [Pirellulales bacterium]|nr:class I SAM-dependent methyltransferase [Pirellulales bacterium]
MHNVTERGLREIVHGKALAAEGAEHAWNWASAAGRVRAKRRAELIVRAANIGPGMRVLEIGCGTGLFTEFFVAAGASVCAVDISPDLLELARQRGIDPKGVKFYCGEFESLDLPGPFDAVVGSSVLHHLDIALSLARIRDDLVPGGRLSFAEPNYLNPQVWAERRIPVVRRMMGASPDETAIVRWRLGRSLRELGFEDISIRNFDWLHPAVPAALIPIVSSVGRMLEAVPLVKEFSGSVLIAAEKPSE